MKRSKTIRLVLLTSALIFGCGEEENMRNKYGSWDDCVADYKDPSQCQVSEERTSTGGMHRYYYGPWYTASRFSNRTYNPGYGTGRSIGVSQGVSRGGFGSSGSSGS